MPHTVDRRGQFRRTSLIHGQLFRAIDIYSFSAALIRGVRPSFIIIGDVKAEHRVARPYVFGPVINVDAMYSSRSISSTHRRLPFT
jgi:hypothetical protein